MTRGSDARAARKMNALLERERALWDAGIERVAGVDEAGVGPLAGPVVAAAVIFPSGCGILGVNDSKSFGARAARGAGGGDPRARYRLRRLRRRAGRDRPHQRLPGHASGDGAGAGRARNAAAARAGGREAHPGLRPAPGGDHQGGRTLSRDRRRVDPREDDTRRVDARVRPQPTPATASPSTRAIAPRRTGTRSAAWARAPSTGGASRCCRRRRSSRCEGGCYNRRPISWSAPLKVHEYQAKAVLKRFGVPVPNGEAAQRPTRRRRSRPSSARRRSW